MMLSSSVAVASRANRPLLSHHRFGEVFERAGIVPAAEQFDLLGGPFGPHVAPLGELVLGGGFPDLLEIVDGDLADPIVPGVDGHRQGIEGNRQLNVFDARSPWPCRFPSAGSGREASTMSSLPSRNFGEAGPGADVVDRDLHVGLLGLEQLVGPRAQPIDRAGAVDFDLAAEFGRGGATVAASLRQASLGPRFRSAAQAGRCQEEHS